MLSSCPCLLLFAYIPKSKTKGGLKIVGFMQNINAAQARQMLSLSSEQLLAQYGGFQLNDLFAPCIKLYPHMSKYRDMFLSGSGSSVFFLK